jgi:hypothetical protein
LNSGGGGGGGGLEIFKIFSPRRGRGCIYFLSAAAAQKF